MHVVRKWMLSAVSVTAWFVVAIHWAAGIEVEFEAYDAQDGVAVRHNGDVLQVDWEGMAGEPLRVVFDASGKGPLIRELGAGATDRSASVPPLFTDVDPALYLTIGTRERPRGNSPHFPQWVFFDNPAKRPHKTYRSRLELKSIVVVGRGNRTVVRIGDLQIGSFRGAWEFTFYPSSSLVKVDAVASTDEPSAAVVYDLGLVGVGGDCDALSWRGAGDAGDFRLVVTPPIDEQLKDTSLAVRGRTLVAEARKGCLAIFPPPHQFYFPRDYTDNLSDLWYGNRHAGFDDAFGIGIRQAPTGGGNWVPWNNAPPRTQQRFGMFVYLTSGHGKQARDRVAKYTHDDRFPELPGHVTFTSHYHMAIAEQAMRRTAEGKEAEIPELVRVFKDMNVQIVHLGEFHGDGHPKDLGPLRLPEMEMMFHECKRLSDDELLLIPGEEINEYLGKAETGKHPGHWMSLFPRPVYWMQKREANAPFVVDDPKYGKVYRVGSREDMEKLIAAEKALVWSAHPRIKASSWAPDAFKDEAFFRDPSWLGAAFKAMPADLSEPRLGRRCLDLLDDMSNWGAKKYLPGEVDVFKINRSHELYGHMNINYLRMDRIPRFHDGWQPVLDVLRRGEFFTTTGEMLIHRFEVTNNKVQFELSWTFPPEFAEIVSGDGKQVFRERIDLAREPEFGRKEFVREIDLQGRTWIRIEAWDTAVNGAYTQPIWLDDGGPASTR